MTRIQEFLTYLQSKLGNIYVWGAQGENLSNMSDPEAWITKMEKKNGQSYIDRALKFYRQTKASGKYPIEAFDCSGLVMFFFQNTKKWLKSDASANGIYNMCQKIDKAQLKPGDFVFIKSGSKMVHIGVFIGNGKTIEAYGRDLGVVELPLAQGRWTHYGRLALLQSAIPPAPVIIPAPAPVMPSVPAPVPTPVIIPPAPLKPYHAVCGGQGVNVRTGRGTSFTSLGKADRDVPMLALPAVDKWHEVAVVLGGKIVTGYMHTDYVKAV
ncbi:MAG TPA: NlpC/P60 family protein [Clostridia bacterium]|nr:NlpC/P60 family protein [Clostridia bacterium]